MKRIGSLSVFTAMIVVLLVTGFAFAQDTIVKVVQKAGIGDYLIDGRGMTLYTFAKDTAGKSACEGLCVETWPPFYTKKVDAQGGLAAGDFRTIARPDGKKQTTYKGMPLYYFARDAKPGDTQGQGHSRRGPLWSVARP